MRNLLRAKGGVVAATLAVSLVAAAAAAPALAAGGGGGGGGGGSSGSSSSDGLNCLPGYVVDPKKHICVRAQSGIVPDDALTDYAFLLAKKERYQDALDTLDLLQNPNTAVALNYRGYATRKLGRTDEGIGYYLQSVAIDPAYPQVREYLGEAYVIKGRLDLAGEQLTQIASLCGTTCEYYTDLAEAIAEAD